MREWMKPILKQAVLVIYERMVPPAEVSWSYRLQLDEQVLTGYVSRSNL